MLAAPDQATLTLVLEIVKAVVPAVSTLLGVGLGAWLTRGRERRSWRRDRLLNVCSSLIDAMSSVEQWAVSSQFADRLAMGQFPTEYKNDLSHMAAAVAALSISASPGLHDLGVKAETAVRYFVVASAEQAGARRAKAETDTEKVDEARSHWTATLNDFVAKVRTEVKAT